LLDWVLEIGSPLGKGVDRQRRPITMPGIQELLIILLIVIIIFGASKLPQLGKGLGEGIKNFKKGIKSDNDETNSDSP
jgi:sec-independent protein translocase protein TatA